MADYDASSMSTRYALDAGERMRTGQREGYWLAKVKFPRPLCHSEISKGLNAMRNRGLELLNACISSRDAQFHLLELLN